MVTVGLFSDEPVLFEGLKAILGERSGFVLVPLVVSSEELCEKIQENAPDVVLIDDGQDFRFSLLNAIRRTNPAVHLLLWTSRVSLQIAHQAMNAGVRGIVRKNLSTDLLVHCLEVVSRGELWLERNVTQSLHDAKTVHLSRREMQLLALVAQGLNNKEIATTLLLTEGTVKYYFSRLFKKMGVDDRFELALCGLRCFSGDDMRKPIGNTVLPERAQSILVEPRLMSA